VKALAVSGAFIPHCGVYVPCLSGLLIQHLPMSCAGKASLMFCLSFHQGFELFDIFGQDLLIVSSALFVYGCHWC
jgi:hypothetical protein